MISFDSFSDELQKIAKFSWKRFKAGLVDEGIPLGGATIGAGIGSIFKKPLVGAALGYSVGGLSSLGLSKLKGEKPSFTRKLLAAGAMGYGLGALGHIGASKLLPKAKVFSHAPEKLRRTGRLLHGLVEEGFPAAGATLGTAYAMGSSKGKH